MQKTDIVPCVFEGSRGTTWYKVTDRNGYAIYGRGKYHLPKDGKPGKWHTCRGELTMCGRGYHVTQIPKRWCKNSFYQRRVFEVEVAEPAAPFGKVVKTFSYYHTSKQTSNKSLFRHMRLVREIKGEELKQLLHPIRRKTT